VRRGRLRISLNWLFGVMMNGQSSQFSLLDVVALLTNLSAAGLARGQVGTVIEISGKDAALVEFSGDNGRAYAIERCPATELLVLHYVSEAAA
jgi:Domain of unknown function (DUF4926)